jgi:predicted MFS family arabinose efflux permease
MAVDKPTLYSFVKDLVGKEELPNAVALNNAVISTGRMIGPAVSGLLIASLGLAPSFFINAVAFGLVVLVLVRLDASRLHMMQPAARTAGQVREGLSYIRRDRVLLLTVLAMSAIFVSVYNFQVMVPLLTVRVLGGASEMYGFVMSVLGLGAVTGSLLIASWAKPGVMMIAGWCGLLSIVHVWLALPLGVVFSIAGVFALGIATGFFSVTVASTLQARARDDMRGRVMALYSMGILGSGLIGAPLAGSLADRIGVSDTLLIIAAVCVATSAVTAWAWTARGRESDDPEPLGRPGLR